MGVYLPRREYRRCAGSFAVRHSARPSSEYHADSEGMGLNLDIKYHRIRVATPRHNGKVERQNGINEIRFYKKVKIYSLADGREQLKRYNTKSNNIPKTCLNFLSPNEVMAKYLGVM